ncbi:MAG: diacylglycerol kinase family protein [Actinomycetota bacterium]|nr:diacylglycerol kinase family protein [Actinomycetota bacterium]
MERFTRESFEGEPSELRRYEARKQKYLVVVNPGAGGGKALQDGIWLLKSLNRLGIKNEAFFTEHPGHAEKIVQRWTERVDVVVAVGGDGTINEAINGMMASPTPDKVFCAFPAGTADDYCHNMGIPRGDRKKALEVILAGGEREIDLIRYNDRYAVVSVGVGFDAEVAYKALGSKKVRLLAYWSIGLRIAFIERLQKCPRSLRITSDSQVYEGRFLIVVFGNCPLFARYVYWMPDAKVDDGIINMSALTSVSPLPGFMIFLGAFRKGYKSDKLIYDASEHFKLEFLEESFMQVDGEVYKYDKGETIDMSVARKALKVRVPAMLPADGPFSRS